MKNYPKQLITDLCQLKQRADDVGWKSSLAEIGKPDAGGGWQFTKYLIIGVTSVLVFYAAYGAFRIFAEISLDQPFFRNRLLWNMLGIFFAFVPTNYFTYTTNRRWVFIDGRHGKNKEFFLFTLTAALSLIGSQFAVWILIRDGRLNDYFIILMVIVISTLINFVLRKFVVFHS